MEGYVAQKLNEFETGRISRRSLIELLTLATTTAYASEGANAQAADPTLKVALINHISYTCPDFKQAADWYSNVFNLDQVGPTKQDVALPFGKKGEQPYDVTAKDVPLTHLIMRTRPVNAAPADGSPGRQSRAVIDHIAYTVVDFEREKAKAALAAVGVTNVRDGGPNSVHVDDPFGYDVQITGLSSTALSGGG
jgi:catechol 2,3-dioxygenase-like lactoylglutathione lyase family enzyme